MKYGIIYADPPWEFNMNGDKVINKKRKNQTSGVNAKYSTMKPEEIKHLTIKQEDIMPYNIVYADPPWKYGNGKNKTFGVKSGEKGINPKYGTMPNEKIADLTIKQEDIMPYNIVYADPPWHFNNKIDNAINSKLELSYPTMSNENIQALPIKEMLADDAACFMWTTDTHMPYALEIMKAWGFTYKTIGFVWVKKSKQGKQIKMVAPWTNKGAEICLFGTKGAMSKHIGRKDIAQVVEAERTIHSKKPQEVADRIVQMFPNCTRIELFARDQKPGWDVWGNDPNITSSILWD